MSDHRQGDDHKRRSPDETAGRNSTRAELRRRLSSAPAAFLVGAAHNNELTVREMLLLLRNRQAPAPLLMQIGGDRGWMRYREVKRGLACHPKAPLVLGRNLLPHLNWNELADVAAAPQVNPVLRRQAQNKLQSRAQHLTLGEQVALARRAVRGVVELLCESEEYEVLRALLGNERMVELDAVKIAAARGTPARLLADLAQHDRWGCRRSVRLALAANPNTPTHTALGVLRGLVRGDLRRLSADPKVPGIVRLRARRSCSRSRSLTGRAGPALAGPRLSRPWSSANNSAGGAES